MSRYVERAEHVARILLVNSNLLIDVGDSRAGASGSAMGSMLDIIRPLDDFAPDNRDAAGDSPR